MHFLEWKCLNSDWNFTEVCSQGPINNIPAMVQIMAWRRPGDKPLSEPMVVSLATHICVARPQWVNYPGCNTKTIYWWICHKLVKIGRAVVKKYSSLHLSACLTYIWNLIVWINYMWPSHAIWWHRSRSILSQVKVCCLPTSRSHYPIQCWIIIKYVL